MEDFLGTYLSAYKTRLFLWFLIIFSAFLAPAQTYKSFSQMSCSFEMKEVEYSEITAVSNVLKVCNRGSNNLSFRLKLSVPGGWRSLVSPERIMTVSANDSVFIPVRLLGSSMRARGGVKYNISALVTVIENGQICSSSFMAGKPKVTNIRMEVRPGSRIYFPNGKMFMPFQVELVNDGNERQDIVLSLFKRGDDVMLTDSVGKFLQKKYRQVSIKAFRDTSLSFGLSLLRDARNFKRIDTWGYTYEEVEPSRRHTVYLKAIEPTPGQALAFDNINKKTRISKTIDFVKLGSISKVNAIDGDVLPLSVLANVNQLFNQQPVVNLLMNGRKTIDDKSFATYLFQNGFSYYRQSSQTFKSAFAQLGYFHTRGSLQLGTGIQLNMPQVRSLGSSGPGIAVKYVVRPGHQLGVFIANNRGDFGNLKELNLNFGYSTQFRKVSAGLGFSLSNATNNSRVQVLSGGLSMPISRHQSFGVRASLENYRYQSKASQGYQLSVNYSINFLKQRASSRVQVNFHKVPSFITGPDSIRNKALFNATLYNSLNVKGFTFQSQHSYFNSPVYSRVSNAYERNNLLNNLFLLYSEKKRKTVLVPGFYVAYSEYFTQRLISEGLQLNISRADIPSNFRMGLSIRGGFNRLLSHPIYGTFFTSQVNSFLTCRTWNVNARYFYGPQSQFDVLSALSRQSKYSQILFLSLGNQYQFRDKHFLIENTLSYNYVYLNMRQSTSLFTQLFYYAQNGWRFNFNINVNYNVAENIRFVYDPAAKSNYEREGGARLQKSAVVQFGFGVKKDFGIPLPKKWQKKKFTIAPFKIFMDLNGNRLCDKEESALENVIVRLNDFEAQSDLEGNLRFENIPLGRYRMQVFSLDNLGSWFPICSDSLDLIGPNVNLVPFTRGVQIMGNVEVSREKFSAGINEKLDISRIKIVAVDSAGHSVTSLTDQRGDFNFYLPFGTYTLRFDESILGADFELVQNDILVQLAGGIESFYHTFFITERKRKVRTKRFDANGVLLDENKKNEPSNNSPIKKQK